MNIRFLVLLGSCFLCGCATTKVREGEVPPERVHAAPTAAKPNAATLVVMRGNDVSERMVGVKVSVDGKPLATFETRESMSFQLDPGLLSRS